MLIFLFLACDGKTIDSSESTPNYPGEELVERYNSATCHLLVDQACVSILTDCGAPVNLFGDWADCMNSQNLNFTHCSNIPHLFEQNQIMVLNCIGVLENAQCNASSLCADGESLLRAEDCAAVNELIVNNCNPF